MLYLWQLIENIRLMLLELFFYKYPHLFLVGTTLVLWLIAFILDQKPDHNELLVWLPVIISQVIITFVYADLVKKLNHGRLIDYLTGLWNRNYIYKQLEIEMSKIKRVTSSLSIAIIDADNFKRINDTKGHSAGDYVLKQLAHILKQNIRSMDTIGRWGGEEFILILPGADSEKSLVLAERLRKKVESSLTDWDLTISIGVSSTEKEIDIDKFIVTADMALLKAKKHKNSIQFAK